MPLVLRFVVGAQYLHGVPTTGNDLAFVALGAAAWPVALVLMALVEVGSRIAVVQVRGRRLVAA